MPRLEGWAVRASLAGRVVYGFPSRMYVSQRVCLDAESQLPPNVAQYFKYYSNFDSRQRPKLCLDKNHGYCVVMRIDSSWGVAYSQCMIAWIACLKPCTRELRCSLGWCKCKPPRLGLGSYKGMRHIQSSVFISSILHHPARCLLPLRHDRT